MQNFPALKCKQKFLRNFNSVKKNFYFYEKKKMQTEILLKREKWEANNIKETKQDSQFARNALLLGRKLSRNVAKCVSKIAKHK